MAILDGDANMGKLPEQIGIAVALVFASYLLEAIRGGQEADALREAMRVSGEGTGKVEEGGKAAR